jgi:hypothetical protein
VKEIKEEQDMIDTKVIEAFKLMWGNFPEPVTLVHRSREVIAVNAACEGIGRVKGMNCAKHGAPEAHRGCLGNQALQTQQPAFVKKKAGEKDIICYWLPIDGYPDYFVHFGVGVTIDYDSIQDKPATVQ